MTATPEYLREWRRRNPEKSAAIGRRHDAKVRAELFAAYGGRCACCGETTPEFLTVDHIGGGGAEHRRSLSVTVYTDLRRRGYPDGFRLLCMNCNFAEGKRGGCPHRLAREAVV